MRVQRYTLYRAFWVLASLKSNLLQQNVKNQRDTFIFVAEIMF